MECLRVEGADAGEAVLLVRMRGLEPPRGLPHNDLNVARLPIPPHPHTSGPLNQFSIAGYGLAGGAEGDCCEPCLTGTFKGTVFDFPVSVLV